MMKKPLLKAGVLTTAAFGMAMLVACNNQHNSSNSEQNQLVECYGVAKSGADVPLLMTKDMCDKLPFSKQTVVNTSDYVQCYGVAAAGQNGCATKNNSCGGFVKVAREADAWVSLPLGVCANLQGAGIGKNPKS